MYTIKQLADLAGVSRRTLHYYDELGLLKPALVADNGYRYYDSGSLLQLQQILLYKELGLELSQIKHILKDPEFDILSALQIHRQSLQEKIEHLDALIQTVDSTLMHLMGEVDMSEENIFEGFSAEKQKQYEAEALERWGDHAAQSIQVWNSYSDERQREIKQEGSQIYRSIAANMDKGADSPEIQSLLARWHKHVRYFYEPTNEMLEGLGIMYCDNPDFNATFSNIHPDLPAFLKKAISIYVEGLKIG
jgi:DNA-binding transcriptional MerR regulator